MSLLHLSRWLTLLVAVLSAISVGALLYSEQSYQRRTEARTRHHAAAEAAAELARGSDVLTAAVRAYAATGDERFRAEFDRELNQTRTRELAVANLRELGITAGELALIDTAKRNSDNLVALENKAFAAAAAGRYGEAVAYVHGEQYRAAKASIMEPIARLQAQMNQRQDAEIHALTEHAKDAAHFVMVALIANVVVVLLVLLRFYRLRVVAPLARITDHARRVLAGDQSVRFNASGEIEEIAALGHVLEAYQQAGETLGSQQRQLDASAEEMQAIFDCSATGIVFVRDRRILRCNRAMERLFGHGPGEMVGHTTRDWYADQETFEEIGRTIGTALREHGFYREDRELLRKDGSRFWGRMIAQPIDPGDLRRGLVGILEDITAERAAAAALRLASEEQQAIFDTATSGIALIKDRVLMRCNRKMHEIFGWPPGEMVGKRTAIWYADEAANQAGGDPVYEVIWQGRPHTRDQQLKRRDGSLFWACLTGNAIDVKDRSKGTVWVIDDITDLRAAIEEMRRARQIAEESTRLKSEFVANMSHEIRTPMNAVIGMAHLLLKTEPTPRQRNYLGKIQAASQHLLGIINDILDFSKIEAGKMTIEHVPFRLATVLDGIVGMIHERVEAKGLALHVEIGPEVPQTMVGDSLRLGQVLLNYANNALKFTEQGEIVIRVSRQTDDGTMLRFEVRDTGIGISPQQMERLFKSFQQADTSTTRKFGGTGLGLAISRNLAQLMGGEVGVESEPGRGSTFWFTARLEACDPALVPELGSFETDTTVNFAGARVLLVEDNDINQEVASTFLEECGIAVDIAGNGQIALDKVRAGDYDLVLMDLQMPVMDGMDATRLIRLLPGRAELPILAMTASAMDDDKRRCLDAGMNDHVAKPIVPMQLHSKLRQWLKPRNGSVIAAGSPPSEAPRRLVSATDSAIVAALAAVPELDTRDGLRLALGRERLYLTLVDKFIADQRDFPAKVAEALAAGDWVTAQRLAHTLKSVAAQVGAHRLSSLAAQLEEAFRRRENSAFLGPLLGGTARQLVMLAEAIEPLLRPPAAGLAEPVDVGRADEVLKRLATQLAADDFACRQLLTEEEHLLRTVLKEDYGWISEAVDNCDFPAAHDWLMEACRKRGLAL